LEVTGYLVRRSRRTVTKLDQIILSNKAIGEASRLDASPDQLKLLNGYLISLEHIQL